MLTMILRLLCVHVPTPYRETTVYIGFTRPLYKSGGKCSFNRMSVVRAVLTLLWTPSMHHRPTRPLCAGISPPITVPSRVVPATTWLTTRPRVTQPLRVCPGWSRQLTCYGHLEVPTPKWLTMVLQQGLLCTLGTVTVTNEHALSIGINHTLGNRAQPGSLREPRGTSRTF